MMKTLVSPKTSMADDSRSHHAIRNGNVGFVGEIDAGLVAPRHMREERPRARGATVALQVAPHVPDPTPPILLRGPRT
jgi:hypothetical protein